MKEKIYRFMQGRYGSDNLNRFLMAAVIICWILSLLGVRFLYIIGIIGLVYAYFRMFSKNIYKRSAENATYLKYTHKIRQTIDKWKRECRQRKTHHIYRCSSCKQKIRIPRGKGKIEITCPKCGNKFIKNS